MRSSGHLGDFFELTPDRGFLSEWNGEPAREIDLGRGELERAMLPERVILRTPHALPQERARRILSLPAVGAARGAARVLVLKSETCATCEAQVPTFIEGLGPEDPLTVSVVSLEAEDPARVGDFVRALVESVLGPGAELALPVSLLLDQDGNVRRSTGRAGARRVPQITPAVLAPARPPSATPSSMVTATSSGPRWFHAALAPTRVSSGSCGRPDWTRTPMSTPRRVAEPSRIQRLADLACTPHHEAHESSSPRGRLRLSLTPVRLSPSTGRSSRATTRASPPGTPLVSATSRRRTTPPATSTVTAGSTSSAFGSSRSPRRAATGTSSS